MTLWRAREVADADRLRLDTGPQHSSDVLRRGATSARVLVWRPGVGLPGAASAASRAGLMLIRMIALAAAMTSIVNHVPDSQR
jgi:hypothetical protein